jgi:hypothetical protein
MGKTAFPNGITVEGGAGPIVGAADGYKIARGETALDGSNPTPAVTGLTTIVAAVLTNKRTTAPGADPHIFTYGTSGGTLNIYAWKPTGAGDTALIASTDADDVIGWIAIGT